MRRRYGGIARLLFLSIGTLVLVASTATGVFVYAMVRSTLIRQSVTEAQSMAQGAVVNLSHELKTHRSRTLAEDMADLATAGTYVLLTTRHGQFLLSKGTPPPSEPARGWSGAPASGWIRVQSTPYAYARRALSIGGHTEYLVVVHAEPYVQTLLDSLRYILVLAEALLVVSLLLGTHLVVRDLTSPLERLRAFADRVARNPGLKERLPTTGALYEADLVTTGFNQMLDRLALAQERERQFASDAAHALRTPVQVIRGYSTSLTRWGQLDPALRSRSLAALQAETSGLGDLIERLLVLSRLDIDDVHATYRAVSLPEFFDRHAPELHDTTMHHALDVTVEPGLTAWTDEALLLTVLRTLLENADAYARPGTPVAISASRSGPGVAVRVTNQGPAIPPDELLHVFERFRRGPEAADSRHYGLGLAIADRVREHLGAEWLVTSADDETVFGLILPARPADAPLSEGRAGGPGPNAEGPGTI